MPQALTIHLDRPIAALRVLSSTDAEPDRAVATHPAPSVAPSPGRGDEEQIDRRQQQLAQSCQLVDTIAGKLNELHEQTVARNQSDIARLAVEIARKILAVRISQDDYDIQSVVEEALKRAPARQDIIVRVNPEDLPQCQSRWGAGQPDHPDGQAELSFVADWSIARADCLIETPKGIVKSFVEEHLARIAEALERAQQP